MSFSKTLNRLREAAKGQRERNGDVLVSAFDLRDLLNDYDRIKAKNRAQADRCQSHDSKQTHLCTKCGWSGNQEVHEGCGYLASNIDNQQTEGE